MESESEVGSCRNFFLSVLIYSVFPDLSCFTCIKCTSWFKQGNYDNDGLELRSQKS